MTIYCLGVVPPTPVGHSAPCQYVVLTPPFPLAFSFNRALLMLHSLRGLFHPFCQQNTEHVHNVTSCTPTSRSNLCPEIQICLSLLDGQEEAYTSRAPSTPLRVLHLVGLHRSPASKSSRSDLLTISCIHPLLCLSTATVLISKQSHQLLPPRR